MYTVLPETITSKHGRAAIAALGLESPTAYVEQLGDTRSFRFAIEGETGGFLETFVGPWWRGGDAETPAQWDMTKIS
jgi:hypothetical protein